MKKPVLVFKVTALSTKKLDREFTTLHAAQNYATYLFYELGKGSMIQQPEKPLPLAPF
jgi:hypothetical protein